MDSFFDSFDLFEIDSSDSSDYLDSYELLSYKSIHDVINDPGLCVAVKFSLNTVHALDVYARHLKLPNLLNPSEYHTTIVYSRKPVKQYPCLDTLSTPIINKGWRNLTILGTDKLVVAVEFKSTFLQLRHQIAKRLGASFDYPQYKPHITLTKTLPPGYKLPQNPPQFDYPITIVKEYTEPLKP